MIRINLNRSNVSGGDANIHVDDAGGASGNATREGLVKILVMSLGIIALLLFQKQNLEKLTIENAAVIDQSAQLSDQIEKTQAEVDKLKDIAPQADALGDKLKLIRKYAKLRIVELQSLDFIQSAIPQRVWLRSIKYENFHYQIFGNAVETVDLSQFVKKLEASAYFQDVIVIQNKETDTAPKLRDFELYSEGEIRN